MQIFVKNRKDFSTTYKAIAQSWEVPVLASTKETGTVTIPKEKRKDFSGDFLFLDGNLYLIDESTPQDGHIELQVSDPANIFSRQLVYPNNPESTYGEFIQSAITREYINGPDSVYNIPYITIENEDYTEFEEPDLDSTRLYSLIDIISRAREKSVVIKFSVVGRNLHIHIFTGDGSPHNVIFSDGHSELESESFSRVKVAKITAMKETDTEGQYATTTWYLSESGDVSNSVPANRAEGDWIYITVNKDENVQTKVKEKFRENISSHKIEFHSDRVYNLWDIVKFQIDDDIFLSSIVGIFLSSNDKRYLYRCGDLATTLTEKVKKIS